MQVRLDVTPVAKPRMTRKDKRVPRPATAKYWAFKDELNLKWNLAGLGELPPVFDVVFHLPMPKSWSKKKRHRMASTPHQQTPDRDNLEKAFVDALTDDDSYIYGGYVAKYWTDGPGYIVIEWEDSRD